MSDPLFRVLRISRSENNPSRAAGSNCECESVSMYCVNELQCEGSELSFEELRARRYFAKCRQQEEQRRLGEYTSLTRVTNARTRNTCVITSVSRAAEEQRRVWEEEEEVKKMMKLLEDLEKNVTVQPAQERKVKMSLK